MCAGPGCRTCTGIPFPTLLCLVPSLRPVFPIVVLVLLRGLFWLSVVAASMSPVTLTDSTADSCLFVDSVALAATPRPQLFHCLDVNGDALDQIRIP